MGWEGEVQMRNSPSHWATGTLGFGHQAPKTQGDEKRGAAGLQGGGPAQPDPQLGGQGPPPQSLACSALPPPCTWDPTPPQALLPYCGGFSRLRRREATRPTPGHHRGCPCRARPPRVWGQLSLERRATWQGADVPADPLPQPLSGGSSARLLAHVLRRRALRGLSSRLCSLQPEAPCCPPC